MQLAEKVLGRGRRRKILEINYGIALLLGGLKYERM